MLFKVTLFMGFNLFCHFNFSFNSQLRELSLCVRRIGSFSSEPDDSGVKVNHLTKLKQDLRYFFSCVSLTLITNRIICFLLFKKRKTKSAKCIPLSSEVLPDKSKLKVKFLREKKKV